MRKSLFIFCPLLAGTIGIMLVRDNSKATVYILDLSERISNSISCGPDGTADIYAGAGGKFISVLPGWGDHSYGITTQSDSAQLYFNQGLSMYYSYHGREALASFREAAKFDSGSAMVYWGQALAMGPSYNFGYLYKWNKLIPAILAQMNRNADHATQKEKDLVNAMNKRYNLADTLSKQRNELNLEYAAAMRQLVAKYKDDNDIRALYTDAVMLVHPWDFWYNDGTPKQWTPELVEICQDILKRDPHHPAALHYYIHVTEASRKPEVALASADSLLKLYPGVAHMVHMSSHEYERFGLYEKGVLANEAADRSLMLYDSLAKGLFTGSVHVPHYYAVDAYCAMSGAMGSALSKATACREIVKPTEEDTYLQYQYMFPSFAMVRLGKWNDILNDHTIINPQWTYAAILNDFAKGMAYTKTGDHATAEQHLKQLKEKIETPVLKVKFAPFKSSPYECSVVAEHILAANILFNRNKLDEAMKAIRKAIRAEDSLIYAEPKIWMLPARQYLGAFLMKMNKTKQAEKVYRDDLLWNPANGWSLLGLHQSLEAQGKQKELGQLKAMYTQSFSKAAQLPPGSVY
jgi:tetratricopeptide (TPR) repeat protein